MITLRALNRATLARQMLLERSSATALEALERVAGLQAQEAKPPYIGLWTRLATFDKNDLLDIVRSREAVRVTAMRGTLHVMSTRDYLAFRPGMQPVLDAAINSILKNRGEGIDVDAFVEQARAYFRGRSATFNDLRAELEKTNPGIDIRAAAYAARLKLPLVLTPDSAPWGWTNDPEFTLASTWLGVDVPTVDLRADDATPNLLPLPHREGSRGTSGGGFPAFILRYLGAFGPATVADFQTWSGLKGAKDAFERLRPQLVTFIGDKKREYFDLPDAPRPDEDTPAPVRFLPDFDNLMLGHNDRTRVIKDEYRQRVATANLRTLATFLVDGITAGTWKTEVKKKTAKLLLDPFEPLTRADIDALVDEGERLLRFIEPEAKGYEVSAR